MADETKVFKRQLNVQWIKGETGSTYLCPVDALSKIKNPTEEDLRKICVEESSNPQND